MKPEVLLLFRQAIDLPHAERAEFVMQAAVDPNDRALLVDLLRSVTDASRAEQTTRAEPVQPARHAGVAGAPLGPFTLLRPLGSGGMGTVWLAERRDKFDQKVAIKWLYGSTSAQARARFARERQVLARLEHPAIARIVDGGEDQGVPWYAMEFVDGENLLHHAQLAGLGLRSRLDLFLQLADAVQFAHQNFIVHRDLKPSNVLVNTQGALKLLDFGIAKLLDGSEHLTEQHSPMTLAYAAPEQVRGEAITAATDVYGLGVLLYELLTGQRPYQASNPAEMLQKMTSTEVTLPSRLEVSDPVFAFVDRRQLRGDLDVILLKALHREPMRRYESARAMADDVRRFLAHQPIHARADSLYYRASKFLRRHAVASALVAVLAVSVIGSAAWAFRKQQEALQSAQSARASNDFLLSRLASASPWQSGATWTVRDLLKDTAQQVAKALPDQPEARISLYRTLREALAVDRPSADALFPAERLVEELRAQGDFQGESEALYQLLRVQMHQIERLDLAEPTLTLLESRLQQLDPDLARKVYRSRAFFENYKGAPNAALQAWMHLLPAALQTGYQFDPTATAFNAEQDPAAVSALIELRRQGAALADIIELLRLLEWQARVGAAADLPQQVMIVQSLVGPVSDLLPPEQALAVTEKWAEFGARQFGEGSAMHQHLATQRLVPLVRAGRFAECEHLIREYMREANTFPEESQLSMQRGYSGLALVAFNEDRPEKVLSALAELDAYRQRFAGLSRVRVDNVELDWLRAWAHWRLGEADGEANLRAIMARSKDLGFAYLDRYGHYELARRAFEQGDTDQARKLINDIDPDGTFVTLNPSPALIELRQSLGFTEPPQYRAQIDALHHATTSLIASMLQLTPAPSATKP